MKNTIRFSLPVLLASAVFALPASAAVPTQLINEYVQTSKTLIQSLETIRDNAGSCGFIGGMVANRMPESINGSRENLKESMAAISRGPNGRDTIRSQIAGLQQSNAELEQNAGMVRGGLSADSPTCRQARAAFETMYTLAHVAPKQLAEILKYM